MMTPGNACHNDQCYGFMEAVTKPPKPEQQKQPMENED